MATEGHPDAHFLVLDAVDWRTYSRVLRTFADRRAIRLTYDRGRLEIRSPLLGRKRTVAQRLVLDVVDWRTYTRLLRTFADRPGLRLTYDRGRLEIMSPLHEHESDAHFLGRLVCTLTEELNLPIKAGGSTTLRRRRKRRGLEPDDCYWIASEPRVRGLRHINLRRDPPPDLAIEIDVTSSSLNRMAIYASLGVPEIWRIDGAGLSFHKLLSNTYVSISNSLAFPLVTPADLTRFLNLRAQFDENSVVREFRNWIRQQQSSPPAPPTP